MDAQDGGIYKLTINEISEEDAGDYTAEAVNASGTDYAKSDLRVHSRWLLISCLNDYYW